VRSSYGGKRANLQVIIIILLYNKPTGRHGMSANPIRGIRRKKSSLTEVKIAVLGAPGVGKSGEQHPYVIILLCILHIYIYYTHALPICVIT